MKRICPICDSEIKIGNYCSVCRKNVKPNVLEANFYLNESHSDTAVHDSNCEFHSEYRPHTVHDKKPTYTVNANNEKYTSYNVNETSGKKVPMLNGKPINQKKSPGSIVAIIIIVYVLITFGTAIFGALASFLGFFLSSGTDTGGRKSSNKNVALFNTTNLTWTETEDVLIDINEGPVYVSNSKRTAECSASTHMNMYVKDVAAAYDKELFSRVAICQVDYYTNVVVGDNTGLYESVYEFRSNSKNQFVLVRADSYSHRVHSITFRASTDLSSVTMMKSFLKHFDYLSEEDDFNFLKEMLLLPKGGAKRLPNGIVIEKVATMGGVDYVMHQE